MRQFDTKHSCRWVGVLISIFFLLFSLVTCHADSSNGGRQQSVQDRISLDPQTNYLENRQFFLNEAATDNANFGIDMLDQGQDSHALMLSAMGIAKSQSLDDLKRLEGKLTEKVFLERLDNPENVPGSYAGLRLAGVLGVLMDNPRNDAHNIARNLIDDVVFQADLQRIQLLAHILAQIRPAPVKVIDYWQRLSQPGSPLTYDVVEALCTNQSDSAMAMLESLFADKNRKDDLKLAWIRQLILPRRNDEAILQVSERLLKKTLPKSLRSDLVEALFDYQPSKWYMGADPPSPPKQNDLSPAAESILRRIAEYAIESISLSDRQRKAIQRRGY